MQLHAVIILLYTAHFMQYSSAAAIKGDSDKEVKEPLSLGWVKHLRIGDVIFAKPNDLLDISEYIATKSVQDDGTTCFGSAGTAATEDAPLILLDEDESERVKREDSSSEDEDQYECLKEVDSLYYYPEFAIGQLENGCTAFLIGPYHAMTSARCVYNQGERLWETKLDFIRAKNGSGALQRMEWEELYIPREFFDRGDNDFDWAGIILKKSEPSPVWHRFQYCPNQCLGPFISSYGYGGENMLIKQCEIPQLRDCQKQRNVNCCQKHSYSFHGGPVFNDYRFDGSKMPPVMGVSSQSRESTESRSVKNEEAATDFVVKFDSDMFWSACYLMEKSGYDPECSKSDTQ